MQQKLPSFLDRDIKIAKTRNWEKLCVALHLFQTDDKSDMRKTCVHLTAGIRRYQMVVVLLLYSKFEYKKINKNQFYNTL